MIERKNAKIVGTTLGYEDHGIFTFMLGLEYDGSGQGAGGYALDTYVGEKGNGQRKGTAVGMNLLIAILKAVGVEKWEDLPGKYIQVEADDFKVHGIGHITDRKRWLNFDGFFASEGRK